MTDRDSQPDPLDRLTEEIRGSEIDAADVERITARSWNAISGERDRPLSGCDDFQALIPALIAGELPPARTMLVEDHTRGCVSCRRALMEARGDVKSPAAMTRSAGGGIPRWLRLAAAAVITLGIGLVGFVTIGNVVADHRLMATVNTPGDTIQLVNSSTTKALPSGTVVRSRQLLRASNESGAELVLADGSVIEMAPRSELDLSGSLRGTTVRLNRGNIIVRAAEQHGRRLFVATDDCRVMVKGTVFAVDHGFKGSRVSVIEGEVEVRRAGHTDVLAPGDQITTNHRLTQVPIETQIAWSPNSEQHAALLRELTSLHRDLVDAIEPRVPRTTSELLDAVPDDTVVYVALPNLAEGLVEARSLLAGRLASSAVLAEWWTSHVVANGVDHQVDELLDRLQTIGGTLGDEIVIAVPASGLEGENAGPVVLAFLKDPETFRSVIGDHIVRANAAATTPVMALVDDPEDATDADAELLLWASGDILVAAVEPKQLVDAAQRIGSPDSGSFVNTDLHARLAEAYDRGVSWVAGVNMAALMERAAAKSGPDDGAIMERLGVMDATSAVIGYSRDGDRKTVAGGLYFDGERRGMAAWLSEPAPMGSLDFVSPQASLAIAGITKDAEVIFDELLAAVVELDPEALAELDEFQQVLGLDLRADLAATLGGEGAFAIDGPILPVPSWKLILEVYDPETLQGTIQRLVTAVNHELVTHGREEITFEDVEIAGRNYHLLRHDPSDFEIALAFVDGYLLVAPQAALIEDAISYRSSGVTLPRSSLFTDLLPEDGETGCSALVWKNLADVLDSLPAHMLESLPPEAEVLFGDGGEPGLWCAYGAGDRILASGSGGGLLTSIPLAGLLDVATQHRSGTKEAVDPLSSAG